MFLRELKTKDFYSTYKDCLEELNKLREAHTILIGMIQNHHLSIGGNYVQQQRSTPQKNTTQYNGSLIVYKTDKG
jgi:hypothetical protein